MTEHLDCPSCGAGDAAETSPGVRTCAVCAHSWQVSTGEPVG